MQNGLFRNIILCIFVHFVTLANVTNIAAQSRSFSISYGLGQSVANHPRFPKINTVAHYFELSWQTSPGINRYWSLLNKNTVFQISSAVQTFGNDQTLGFAFSIIPSLSFQLFNLKKLNFNLNLGAGIGYLNKKFDSYYNPQNIAIGTHLNASVFAKFNVKYNLPRISPYLSLSVIHYSNGNAMSPNLGINIPFIEAGLSFNYIQNTPDDSLKQKKLSQLPDFKRRWSPFIQLGLGMSASVSGGPFFPVPVISAGVNWHYRRGRKAWGGLEYSFNSAVYQFYQHIGTNEFERKDFDRYAFWLGHEWFFGHFSLFTHGGLYLNKHVEQKSLFSTQIGINFYPKLPYKYFKNQFWIGIHVRAYTGLAEFVMLQIGYHI
jgi:hypothetical protein